MAKWSDIWKNVKPAFRQQYITEARLTKPFNAIRKTSPKGKYPHLQPFFKNRKIEQKEVQAVVQQAARQMDKLANKLAA